MRLADAWALLPELTVLERDVPRERQRLQALACWAGGFTSEVSLSPPDALLLEVQGSLRLFGGLEALLARILDGIAAQAHVACVAVAPTPRAACYLAGEDPAQTPGPCCSTLAELRESLARLPLQALALPSEMEKRVAGFGVRMVGDLLRLPRAGLVRRLGKEFGSHLAQALGELPDPRPRFRFPETFDESLELPARVEDAARLLFAAQRLIMMLCGWLAARSSGVATCRWCLVHETKGEKAESILSLNFSAATRDAERIGRVLRERLEQLQLAAPVVALRLQTDAPEAMPGREGGLFGEDAAGEGVLLLVERLQARLGEAGVRVLATAAEHRPEQASRALSFGAAGMAPPAPPMVSAGSRPCWLLEQPKSLPERSGQPQHGGPLTLLAGPERIESGWWDAGEPAAVGDVRRDYFVALSPQQEWLWVFRSQDGWFLHGFFA